VLHIVKEKKNILYTVNRRKANWIGQILLRICPLNHVIEGKWRRGRRHKQLLDYFEDRIRYWNDGPG
jgi:hypothetical protein